MKKKPAKKVAKKPKAKPKKKTVGVKKKGLNKRVESIRDGSKYNWARAKDLYLKKKYKTYEEVAEGEGIPFGVVCNTATLGQESWKAERLRLDAELREAQAEELRTALTASYVKDSMDQLRVSRVVMDASEKALVKQAKSKTGLPAWMSLQGLSVASNLRHQAGYKEIGEGMLKKPEQPQGLQSLTAIQQLTVVIQNSGPGVTAKVVDALGGKLSKGSAA